MCKENFAGFCTGSVHSKSDYCKFEICRNACALVCPKVGVGRCECAYVCTLLVFRFRVLMNALQQLAAFNFIHKCLQRTRSHITGWRLWEFAITKTCFKNA